MKAAELDFWRKTVAGEAGYNGHPQALLKLMAVSDAAKLDLLARAYPEAVHAFREERGEKLPAVQGTIRLTFLNESQRSFVDEYETADLAEALIEQAARGFRLQPVEDPDDPKSNRGPETWIVAFIVERDGAVMDHEEVVRRFRRMAGAEMLRGPERSLRPVREERSQ